MADESYHRVGSRIWLERWDDDTRLAALYLLTCRHRITEGIFHLPEAYAVADLGWPTRRYAKAFQALRDDDFIDWDPDAEVVLVVNALKWQTPANPNQLKGAVRRLRQLPTTTLSKRFRSRCETLCPALADALQEQLPEAFGT